MNKNLIFAFRDILKNGLNSTITIVGTTIGIACVLMIYLYVSQEKSFNNFYPNKDQVYRLNYERRYVNGEINKTVLLNYKLAEQLQEKVPQINKSTAYRSAYRSLFKYNENKYTEKLSFAQPNFFEIFSYQFIAKNKDDIFTDPYEVVITQKLADKFLTKNSKDYESILGQHIEFPGVVEVQYTITGIIENIPKNSSINFDVIIPYSKYESGFGSSNNGFGNSLIYILLNKEENLVSSEGTIVQIVNNYYKSTIESYQQNKVLIKSANCFTPFLLSLNDVYLERDIFNDYEVRGSRNYLNILSAIGVLILLIACCNFVILATGQSLKKVGEVGIRKAIGASFIDIFNLFFSQGLLFTFSALVLGLGLCYLLFPYFSELAQTKIYPELINFRKLTLFIVLVFFSITLFTSIIPVLIFGKVKPDLMSSKKFSVGRKGMLSRVFVAFQYSISITLLIVTIFIVRQTHFMKHQSLGFSPENILDINVSELRNSDRLAFNALLKTHSGIVNTSITDRNMIMGRSSQNVKKEDGENVSVRIIKVDDNYISTLGLNLIKGTDFREENVKRDDRSIIINEELVSQLNIKNDPIGKIINISGVDFSVIGVTSNFHYDSMKEKIEPLALYSRTDFGNNYNSIFTKFDTHQISQVLAHIRESWSKITPENELNYTYWDKELENRYREEEQWSMIVGYASGIAIIISLLGLFGLTVLLINQRIKEIGIRRVNGAKVVEVVGLLNKSFLTWLIIALLIATPIAYFIATRWLENFAYKIGLDGWIFIAAGAGTILLALLTVSWQSWRAAIRNPVEALRYE